MNQLYWYYKVFLKSNGTGITNNFFNSKQHGFLFKVILLKYNTLSYPSLPCFYALLELFFWDAVLASLLWSS